MASIRRLTLHLSFPSDVSPFDCQVFSHTLKVWFPSLVHLTLLTKRDDILALRANLGLLPFSVEILDYESVDTESPDW